MTNLKLKKIIGIITSITLTLFIYQLCNYYNNIASKVYWVIPTSYTNNVNVLVGTTYINPFKLKNLKESADYGDIPSKIRLGLFYKLHKKDENLSLKIMEEVNSAIGGNYSVQKELNLSKDYSISWFINQGLGINSY